MVSERLRSADSLMTCQEVDEIYFPAAKKPGIFQKNCSPSPTVFATVPPLALPPRQPIVPATVMDTLVAGVRKLPGGGREACI